MQTKVKEWFDITVSDDIADAIGIGKYISEIILNKIETIDCRLRVQSIVMN